MPIRGDLVQHVLRDAHHVEPRTVALQHARHAAGDQHRKVHRAERTAGNANRSRTRLDHGDAVGGRDLDGDAALNHHVVDRQRARFTAPMGNGGAAGERRRCASRGYKRRQKIARAACGSTVRNWSYRIAEAGPRARRSASAGRATLRSACPALGSWPPAPTTPPGPVLSVMLVTVVIVGVRQGFAVSSLHHLTPDDCKLGGNQDGTPTF